MQLDSLFCLIEGKQVSTVHLVLVSFLLVCFVNAKLQYYYCYFQMLSGFHHILKVCVV